MKPIFLSILTLCFLTSCATQKAPVDTEFSYIENAELKSINLIDFNNLSETITNPERLKQFEETDFLHCQGYKKIMRIYARDETGSLVAYVTSYFPNSQVKQYLEIVNGRACGKYKEWHENGELKVDAILVGGEPDVTEAAQKTWLFDGLSLAYDSYGNKLAEIHYKGGALNGCATYYHDNGAVWKTIPYEEGKIHGTLSVYLANGNLLQKTEYVQNEMNGLSVRYWTDTQLASKEEFNKGKLINGSYFDTDGTLITEVKDGVGKRTLFGKTTVAEITEIKGGLPEGKVEKYDTNGALVSTHYLKNGIKNGEERFFYPGLPLRIKLSVNWNEGKLRGLVRTWYTNGQLETQKEYSDNILNGLSSAWYSDGLLMYLEEYEKDKLVKGEYYRRGDKAPMTEVRQGEGIATLFDADGHFLRKINYRNGKPNL